jgi:hypothetical protein
LILLVCHLTLNQRVAHQAKIPFCQWLRGPMAEDKTSLVRPFLTVNGRTRATVDDYSPNVLAGVGMQETIEMSRKNRLEYLRQKES